MGDNQHRRIDFVDLTKGVCIILVVMAHIGGAFDNLTSIPCYPAFACLSISLYQEFSSSLMKDYTGSLSERPIS